MKIKQAPEDFQVKEIINLNLSKDGDYTYFLLKKKNWTTIRAIQQIAKKLRVSKKRFGFAGNKDKNAITEQAISVWKVEPERLKSVNIKNISIKILGKGEDRICLGDLKGNRFKVRVLATPKEIKNAKDNILLIKKHGFPNYFGEQRFGSSANTHLIGEQIIKGNLEAALKELLTSHGENQQAKEFAGFAKKHWKEWTEIIKKCPNFLGIEKAVLNWLIKHPTDYAGALRKIPKPTRRIFVHAYQSWHWNLKLNKLIRESGEYKKISFLGIKLAMPKYKLKVSELQIPPLTCKRMPELNCPGTFRSTITKPKNLKIEFAGKEVKINFEIEKGSYATILLKCLFSAS